MYKWATEMMAICNSTGELTKYAGKDIFALTFENAQSFCDIHYPYLKVIGKLTLQIEGMETTYDANVEKN